ncbi:MAG: hypothetical protein K2X47_16585 [Bdellovibrionales bacterium]|nr:hypothetical protein [Bdellovibrionales bacterium]
MADEIQDKFKTILSQVSENEKTNNRSLVTKTKKVLIAIEYLKAVMRMKKKES